VRIGILGGTFDPPHHGHLLAAGDAFEALELDRLVFMPTAVQPLKAGRDAAPAGDRLEMIRRLVGDDPRFEVSEVEIARGGLSYTVDTLRTLTAEWPGADLFWLVGADVPKSFAKWREPERIVELATIVVLQRTDQTPDLSRMPGTPRFIRTRRIDISSTEIRERVRSGKSIRGFVPESVAAYIAAHRLYR
jgi:nicotinate-nucleotide adenylyltransferase